MIALLSLSALEWACIGLAAVTASAATTGTDLAIVCLGAFCAALCRQIGHDRRSLRRWDAIRRQLDALAAPANDGGRDGR